MSLPPPGLGGAMPTPSPAPSDPSGFTTFTPSLAAASVTPRTSSLVEPRAYPSILWQGEAAQANLGCGII